MVFFFVGDTSRLLCYFQHFMLLKYYTDMGNLLFCRGTLADRYVLFHLLCNISNMRCSVSSPDETPRRELKIRRAAEYF